MKNHPKFKNDRHLSFGKDALDKVNAIKGANTMSPTNEDQFASEDQNGVQDSTRYEHESLVNTEDELSHRNIYNTQQDSQRNSARVSSSGPLLRDKGQIDQSRKNLYHKMLKKYIDKKEKLSSHKPLDLPPGPSYTSAQSASNFEK